ncbi:putative peptidyl-tRNA hydrolase 2-like protein [Leptotrombidium deliense]|uniref:peptidyl-tRNA hydrolase n=1 Tax=Leptotrombidium deliense TaxID=299467 RepID=A0A443SIL4_9ACAR|nr:putative peptidyl-tRNA hydrolase 2-like protein [Leptotrombidium deliense]
MADKSERGVGDGEEATSDVAKTTGKTSADATSSDSSLQQTTKNWEPNSELMTLLTSMGITHIAAKKALFYTGNNSAEMAAAWIFENPEADLETPLELEASDDKKTNSSLVGSLLKMAFSNENTNRSTSSDLYKMVFVVNQSLEMGVGKIAAQVAHSAIGIHSLMLQDKTRFGDALTRWYVFGQTKIVLRGNTTQHLVELEKKAIDIGLATYLVHDAGKTQIPSGSKTVLSIFGKVDLVDSVTGSLRLL